jgi:HlyD family secretion protein
MPSQKPTPLDSTQPSPTNGDSGTNGSLSSGKIALGAFAVIAIAAITVHQSPELLWQSLTAEESSPNGPTTHEVFKMVAEGDSDSIGDELLEVSVTRPRPGGIPRTLIQTGSLKASESAKIFSRVDGYVQSVRADIGTFVKAGDVLVEIQVPELQQELHRARAKLGKVKAESRRATARLRVEEAEKVTEAATLQQAEADIARFVAQRKLREKEVARISGLAERGSIELKLLDEKQSQLEQAQAAEEHARNTVEVARARLSAIDARIELARSEVLAAESSVEIAEVDVQQAMVMVDFAKITAPFTGVVTSRNCDLGDFVRGAAQGSSQPLFTIAQTERMRVVVSIPDRMVPFIRAGDAAEVRIDSLYGEVFSGQVARVAMQQDRQTRSMRAEIDLANPDGRLIEGMYGSVKIVSEPPKNTVTIPASALVGEIIDGFGRLRVVNDGRIKDVLARIGLLKEDRAEIINWINSSDPIVLEGGLRLNEGGLVDGMVFADGSQEIAGSSSSGGP